MKAAILQSNYIPWKGVFDMIRKVDSFVFFDDVDFTKRDWRTRNTIKTHNGNVWLTVPVQKKPRGTKIYEMDISYNEDWRKKHLTSIQRSYSKAKYFDEYSWVLDEIYSGDVIENLSEFNIKNTKLLCSVLGIKVDFINSRDLDAEGTKDDRLLSICKKVGATSYLSGPAAKDYIDPLKFIEAGVTLEYIEYQYPTYEQLHGEFDHYVSVLDLIFNCGPEAIKHL